MTEENKIVTYEVVDGKFKVCVDPNKDGEPVICITLDAMEVFDEITSALKKD